MLPTIRMNTAASAGDFARSAMLARGTSSSAAAASTDLMLRSARTEVRVILRCFRGET
jgi:hypothetical protein